MKKSIKGFSVDTVSKDVASRKKRKKGVLKDDIVHDMVLSTGDTTESDSVNMKEEFLIEKTSVDYGKGNVLEEKDSNQMPKSPRLITKQALGKFLGKINFLGNNDNDDILLDEPVKLVDVSVRKFFTLNIDLNKLAVVRKLFSKINSFGGASTSSKFSGIIWAMFTSKSSLMKATKLAADAKILVNTDLKKSTGCSDQTVVLKEILVGTSAEAVCTALAEFGTIKSIKMQLEQNQADFLAARWSILIEKDAVRVDHYRVLLYTLPVRTNVHDIWDFIGSVGGKTCVIDYYPITYAWARCAIVCFESVELLDAVMGTTPMLKSKLGHTSLDCVTSKKPFSGGLPRQILLDADKSRLAAIYAKHLVPVACPVSFGGVSWAKIVVGFSFSSLFVWNVLLNNGFSSKMKPTLQVSSVLNDRFTALEHSLISLAKCMDKLAKRLDAPGPMVSQLSPGCQLLVTLSSQNQGTDIVMSEGLGVATGGETVAEVAGFDSLVVSRMEETLRILSVMVMSLSARIDNVNLVWKFAICNVRGINVPAKQENVVCWHREMENLVSIVTETKLRSGCRPWIKDRFNGVQVFTSGLDTGFLGARVAIIMDVSLAQHVSKISEVSGQLLSIKLLFKNKLSVSILRLYAGISSVVQFSQAGNINSFIVKTVNESFFIIFGSDFNENDSHKYVSFKKCLDLRLVNSLVGSPAVKKPTWANSKSIRKTINYMFVFPNLVNAIVNHDVLEGADKSKWINFKGAMSANAAMFSDDVLEYPFHKVILDHLVVNNKLILEPGSVKSKVDEIMEGWTRKRKVVSDIPEEWYHQYRLLSYVFDKAFWGVMQPIEFLELFGVVSDLSDGKAASLLALIKTACKILSKIFFDRILLVYSTHDIFYGDNFSVLKGTTTQTPIFAIDMQKAYNSVGWEHLEKCLVMTNFSLSNGYCIYDELDQKKSSIRKVCVVIDSILILSSKVVVLNLKLSFLPFLLLGPLLTTQFGKFFQINDISINNDKTVAISINSRISNLSLFINDSPISIAKKGKSHQYLGIFLLTNGLSRPSLAKAHLDIHFFSNLVLKKVVSDKQFLYLVSAVLYPIISYRTQFSFVPVSVGLKLKSDFPLNFPSNTIHHLFFYGLKSFSQCQSECKIASLISFVNSHGVLGQLFSHKSHDLQVLCWRPIHLLNSLTYVCVSTSNNFLSGVVRILLDCNLFLGGSLASFFWLHNRVLMSTQLKRLDSCGPVPEWFKLSVAFLGGPSPPSLALIGVSPMNICESSDFVSVRDYLFQVGSSSLSVYTDGSLKNLGMLNCRNDAAAFFEDINLGLGVSVHDLISSTLVELQAIALALECMLRLYSVHLFLDSQAALDACKSELGLMCPNFHNQFSWHKVKSHSGILGNEHADSLADAASLSDWFLPSHVSEHFLVADGSIVSGNFRHFKIGSGSSFLVDGLLSDVDWLRSFRVWHSDSHMATGFTSRYTADFSVQKHLYNKCYSSVLCLYCKKILNSSVSSWKELSGLSLFFSCVLQLLLIYTPDFLVSSALFKGFVFSEWFSEAVFVFYDPKVAGVRIINFACSFCLAFRDDIWLVCVKHHAFIEKCELIPVDGSVPISISGSALKFSTGVVKLLGMSEALSVCFGLRKHCLFFSGIDSSIFVVITV
ncbi:hypothetical protein G9A89_021212 [Geosiphon pyriformis]|nr:hypothetical protein G9A89_021212 [Geosiphon pyriformis]